eukprot:jgi/Galph1/3332/GphlegSOOS_G1980.1
MLRVAIGPKKRTNSQASLLHNFLLSIGRCRMAAGAGVCAGVAFGNCATIGGLYFPPGLHAGVSAGTGFCLGYGLGLGADLTFASFFSWLESILRQTAL